MKIIKGETISKEQKDYFQQNDNNISNQKWIDLLINNGGNINEYLEVKECSKSVVLSIMKYRNIINSRKQNKFPLHLLEDSLSCKKYKEVHKHLQEQFLEIIPTSNFIYIINKINSVDKGIQKLYNYHITDKNVRLMTHIILMK